MIKLKETIKKAEKDERVKDLRKKGYYLNSGISILKPDQMEIKDWILTYYNENENKVAEVLIGNDGIQLKEPATPMQPTKEELDLKDIKTNINNMFKKAKKEFKKFNKPLSQVIITVQKQGRVNFRFNFITKTLEIISITIDAKEGGILGSEITALTKPS